MNPTRCECCHRYAPKVHGTDDPAGKCRGHVAIEEARNLARLWYKRAIEAGWVKPEAKDHGKPATMQEFVDHDFLGTMDRAMDAEIDRAESRKADKPKTRDEILHEKWLAEGKDLRYCQGPRRHFFIAGSPMHETLLERGCFHCGALPE